MGFLQKFRSVFASEIEAELDKRIFDQRAHRIQLLRPEIMTCRFGSGDTEHEIRVQDASETGVGFFAEDWPQVGMGDRFDVTLQVDDDSFAAGIEIVRLGKHSVGTCNTKDLEAWQEFLRRHFAIELEASTLHLVDSGLLKPPPEGKAWWFFSPQGRELYLVADGEHLIRYHLVFRGHYFDGQDGSFRYGQVRSDRKDGGGGIKEAHQIIPRKSDQVPLQEARRFVSNIERLPENYLREILNTLIISNE